MIKKTVEIISNEGSLTGDFHSPDNAKGIVMFAHGSGSSRFSPRNNYVADFLNQAGFATLLLDLLTEEEEKIDESTREFRFNLPLLSYRLSQATDWLDQNLANNLPIGYFGASTGAGAALMAAAVQTKVKAIVSRGGRPDLAGDALIKVKAPTLLIVGGLDLEVIELNQQAQKQLYCENELQIVPDATHLFEEPGTLEKVTQLAAQWFDRFLTAY